MPVINKCPNCGASLELKNPDFSKVAYCSYCNSQIDLEKGEASKSEGWLGEVVPAESDIELGMVGEFDGEKYQVIGRIRYKDEKEYSVWDEWLLLSESGKYLWLTEEHFGFVLMRKYTPKIPFDPNAVVVDVKVDGYILAPDPISKAETVFYEGELTWKAKIGEKINYLDAPRGKKIVYSCEWTDREINYFIGEKLTAQEVYDAFGLGPVPRDALKGYQVEETYFQKSIKKLVSHPAYKLTLIFGFLQIITALILGMFGEPVKNLGTANAKTENYVMLGPYKLDKKGRVYKLYTKASGLKNESAYLTYAVLNKDKKQVGIFNADFWHESGVDGGEYWSEKKNEKTISFVLKEPGEYIFKVSREKKDKKMPGITIKIKEGTFDTGLLWTLALIILFYPGVASFLWLLFHSSVEPVS